MRVWRFLTNDTVQGEVDQFIDNELRPLFPNVTIEVWGLKTLADEISKLKREQVDRIIDVITVDEPEFEVVFLGHVKTGRDLWPILSGCLGWLEHDDPEDCTEEEQDLIDGAVQSFRDCSEISDDVEAVSRAAVRDAQRSLTDLLEELKDKGFALYAGTRENQPFAGGTVRGNAAIFRIARMDPATPTSS